MARRIRQAGPMPVSEYMALALGHPEHGYYTTRDPFGLAGDFTTAPEISQMFGELAGLWCVQHWRTLGGPSPLSLIELGPGRGTLMADALRAARLDPAFLQNAGLHLVETSPLLRETQAKTLAPSGMTPVWHDSVEAALSGAAGVPFIIANEFFDALPVRQFVRGADGWHERMVGLHTEETEEPRLAFGLSPEAVAPDALDHPCAATAQVGALIELAPARNAVAALLAAAVAVRGGAALIIDYGYARPAPGDTLQALRRHAPHNVLDDPGSADITAHVDFDAISRAARNAGAAAFGPLGQGEWLTRLGIRERAAMLARSAPEQAAAVDTALERLTGANRMGTLFKALAIGRKGDPPPPGFEPPPESTAVEGF
jgi:NADH dehydrogenase [ubiquinone] 1 alpha subcomplex assembly factor 7